MKLPVHNPLRRDGYRVMVDALARKRPLRTELSSDDATTILLVLVGNSVYRSMLAEHGWAEQKWRSWLIETLLESLFAQAAARREARRPRRSPRAEPRGLRNRKER